jgi:hypothetical protein
MSSPASVKLVRVLLNLGFVVHDRFQQCLRVFSCEVMDICLAERSQASSVEPDSLDRPPLFVCTERVRGEVKSTAAPPVANASSVQVSQSTAGRGRERTDQSAERSATRQPRTPRRPGSLKEAEGTRQRVQGARCRRCSSDGQASGEMRRTCKWRRGALVANGKASLEQRQRDARREEDGDLPSGVTTSPCPDEKPLLKASTNSV